jgi:hypothetical protein
VTSLALGSSSTATVPFLPVREEFHPKRNQARQKLATLPTSRFEDLSSDVFFELARRYPEFKEDVSDISFLGLSNPHVACCSHLAAKARQQIPTTTILHRTIHRQTAYSGATPTAGHLVVYPLTARDHQTAGMVEAYLAANLRLIPGGDPAKT